MSFSRPKIPLGIGDIMMRSVDPPLLFPADDLLLTPGALTYSKPRTNDGAGDTVAACSGCGSRETLLHEGRHQCAYCRADRNSAGKSKPPALEGEFERHWDLLTGMVFTRPEWTAKIRSRK